MKPEDASDSHQLPIGRRVMSKWLVGNLRAKMKSSLKNSVLKCSLPLLVLLQWFSVHGVPDLQDDNPFRHSAMLDREGNYQLEWLVDFESRRVNFNVTVNTNGCVLFGLAKRGNMDGADIVMGGVAENGEPYFTDRYAIGKEDLPEVDDSQDWTLHSATQTENCTILSFSRAFDTCDEGQDIPITDDLLTIIWSYNDVDDQSEYPFKHRGAYDVYLLDPDLTPRGIQNANLVKEGQKAANFSIFSISRSFQRWTQETVSWCSFHRVPKTATKQHIIGFNTVFANESARDHVQALVLYRCKAPPGFSEGEFFNGAARSGGAECNVLNRPNIVPTSYCREIIHPWATGGRAIFFPEHAAVPMFSDEYFMVRAFYGNPQILNLTEKVDVSLDIYYTSNLRENDIGLLQILQPGPASLVIPPDSSSHAIHGHCAPECTQRILPAEGIHVLAVLLHAHDASRSVRALHFRNNTELSYISGDDSYNPYYQQFRTLRRERKVLPGDLLSIRCEYDTTDRDGEVVTAGMSRVEEMCSAFMYYYNRVAGFSLCQSGIREKEYWDFLGIGNATWDESVRQTVLTSPAELYGVSFRDYLNSQLNWTLPMSEQLQRLQSHLPQISECPRYYFENATEQIGHQFNANSLEKIGKLPGSDGRSFFSVDEEAEFEVSLPRNIPRYSRPPPCSNAITLKRNELD